jgi:hypothetical protein
LSGWEQAKKPKRKRDNMADASLEVRRIAREQESRIAASAAIGLNAAKPFVQFQTSMLRIWAENLELAARNYETGLDALGMTIEEQRSQTRQ